MEYLCLGTQFVTTLIMRKRIAIYVLLLLCFPVMAGKTYTVVLDAGHGGKDPGAVGKISQEKDLNLSLVLEVGKLLNAQYPDVKVVYTRSTDVFIPLQTRADIANKNNADLFISIHTNSAESKVPSGVETFILGTDKMEKNLDVAMRENAVMMLEADYKTTYMGFDPNSIDSYIMFELLQNTYMDQSLQFATQVQQRFVGQLNRDDRGVRQAAFWVLLKTACPSILFEMGFISNPEEERYLNNAGSIHDMAQAIVDAFGAYTRRTRVAEPPAPQDTVTTQEKEPVIEKDAVVEKKAEPVPVVENETKAEKVLYYAIQICASKVPLEPSDARLKGMECEYTQVGEWYKYYTAADTNRDNVAKQLPELRKRFPDCWIITVEK